MPDPGPGFEDLRYEVDGAIATITLDRPDALNALTARLKSELLGAVRAAERDAAVRVVVVTGAGRAFCAGQDLRERLEPDPTPLATELRDRYNPVILALRRIPKPVVAAVNGVAAGAGASLAFAADLRIMGATASFALAFSRIGLVPDSGATWFLPRLVGASKAAELAMFSEPLRAADAERLGLVAAVVPPDELPAAARALADKLAALPPIGLALTKRALEASWSATLDEQLETEAYLQGVAGATADHAEAVAAFVEKRPARFEGR